MLSRVDRILAVLAWVAAAAVILMLFAGPIIVAEDKPAPAAAGQEQAAPDGRAVFTDNCGSCHTLSAAGTSGAVGPELDGAGLDAAAVESIVRAGSGAMPSFEGDLDDAEIDAVAAFVAEASGG
jgi:mono/diheme cytochrome c family protein